MQIKIIDKSRFALPRYETDGSAGMDLRCNTWDPITLQPMERKLIPTGIYMELPEGYEAQIRPRSGLSLKRGLMTILGTVDSDYRGEIGIILINLSNEPQTIEPGDRMAQMVINKYERVDIEIVSELSETKRGEGGFSSTGVK